MILVLIHQSIYLYIYIYTCIQIFTYMHIHIYKVCAHIHTHTYIYSQRQKGVIIWRKRKIEIFPSFLFMSHSLSVCLSVAFSLYIYIYIVEKCVKGEIKHSCTNSINSIALNWVKSLLIKNKRYNFFSYKKSQKQIEHRFIRDQWWFLGHVRSRLLDTIAG